MTVSNLQSTATPVQQEAASATINTEEQISKFIIESKKAAMINYVLTGIIIILTIINVVIAITD